jgi:hypothetical protein
MLALGTLTYNMSLLLNPAVPGDAGFKAMLKSEHELLSKETFTSVARGRG